jgi:polar amino acid transport system substrate-binding protein
VISPRKRCIVVAALLLLAAIPAGASTLSEVKSRGKLVMLSFPHQESAFIRVQVEVDLHHYDGIDYEILDGFAKSLGVTLEVHPVRPSFADLVPALLRGDGDVIGSSFSITPERRGKVDFSAPYFAGHAVVVVPRESPIHTEADLAGRTGATVRGSSLEERMRKVPGVRFHYVDFTRWNYDALIEKTADFSILDETSTWGVLPSYPDLKVAFVLPGEDLYGFAVTPKSDLREALDAYLETIQRNGQLEKIVQRYLGEKAESGLARRGGAARVAADDIQSRETRQEVESAMRLYAEHLRTGPVEAIVSSYTAAGQLLQPGMAPLAGREAIRAFLAPLADKFTVKSVEMATASLQIWGATAYQWGIYRQEAGPKDGAAATYSGRYVAEWRREADGQWRIERLMMQPVESPGR